MPFLALLFALLPEPRSDILRPFGYTAFYDKLQMKLISWHKDQIRKYDPVEIGRMLDDELQRLLSGEVAAEGKEKYQSAMSGLLSRK